MDYGQSEFRFPNDLRRAEFHSLLPFELDRKYLSISSVHASIEIELYDVAGARRGIFEQEVNNYESKCKESVTSLFANQTSESPPPL